MNLLDVFRLSINHSAELLQCQPERGIPKLSRHAPEGNACPKAADHQNLHKVTTACCSPPETKCLNLRIRRLLASLPVVPNYIQYAYTYVCTAVRLL